MSAGTGAHADRRVVHVSITPAGRQVVDQATARRRVLLAAILAKLPPGQQLAVAAALESFAAVAGEIPDSEWPEGPAGGVPALSPGTEAEFVRASQADEGR